MKNFLNAVLVIIFFAGFYFLFYGLGGGGRYYHNNINRRPFNPGIFFLGLVIAAPIYLYFRNLRKKEEPLLTPETEIINNLQEKLKDVNYSQKVNLNNAVIEDCIFTFGKSETEYLNIFLNKNLVELVTSKITLKTYRRGFLTEISAMTNIDKVKLKEIFECQFLKTTVYFDRENSEIYFLDLEFLKYIAIS